MFKSIVTACILATAFLHPVKSEVPVQDSSRESAFCIQEKEKIASLPHVRFVIWQEDKEGFRAELSEVDAKKARELLLAHTRYKSPLTQERQDYWDNIDDGFMPPKAMLVFEGGDNSQSLELSIGCELISESQNKWLEEKGYNFIGVEILMDDNAYRQLLQILRPYLPADMQGPFEQMAG